MERRQVRDAQLHQQLIETMRRSMAVLEQKLAAALAIVIPNQAKRQEIVIIKCRLWVLNGAIEHGFNYRLLEKVSDQHEKIGMVPKSYNYPLLYQ